MMMKKMNVPSDSKLIKVASDMKANKPNPLGMIPGKMYGCRPYSDVSYGDYYRWTATGIINNSLLTGMPTLVVGNIMSGISAIFHGITYELIDSMVKNKAIDFVGYCDGYRATILKAVDISTADVFDEDYDDDKDNDHPDLPF